MYETYESWPLYGHKPAHRVYISAELKRLFQSSVSSYSDELLQRSGRVHFSTSKWRNDVPCHHTDPHSLSAAGDKVCV